MMKLRKTLYTVLCLMASLCTLTGCIEEFNAEIPSDETNLLVVEGSIRANDYNTFILSRTQTLDDSDDRVIENNASVSVRGTDGSEITAYLVPYSDCYGCWIDALNSNVEYYLHIEVDGEVYESEPQKPMPTEGISDVACVQNTPESDLDILVTPESPDDPSTIHYYQWTYEETWEVHPDYTTNMYYDVNLGKGVFKMHQFPERGWINDTGSTIMVGSSRNYESQHIEKLKLYDIDRSDERVHHRYSGLIHQRAISKAEYEYELARRQAGDEMGGLFTPMPSALPTNIHCLTSSKRVIGYIGCSLSTSEYRFFINADDYNIYYPYKPDMRYWAINPSNALCLRLVNDGMYLCIWKDERLSGGELETAWAYEYQLDVRYKGAYIYEPDFWKLEENVSY